MAVCMKKNYVRNHKKKFFSVFGAVIFSCVLGVWGWKKDKVWEIPVRIEVADVQAVLEMQMEETETPETEELSGGTILKISETAGIPGKDRIVLTGVWYDESLFPNVPVKFLFSDGTAVEWQSQYSSYTVNAAECLDVTGDGVKELLLWGYYVNTITEYHVLNIFQIDGRDVTELSFEDDIEELKDEVCNTHVFYMDRGDRKGYALSVQTYGKELGIGAFMENQLEIFYENGKWMKLPRRNLTPRVSLESDSEEARLYEAFLRGECNAEEAKDCRNMMRYCHLSLQNYENFSFQDILEGILADSRTTYQTVVPLESVECGLVDCVESVEYGLIDCGNDGKPELALRVCGVHEYAINDDCDVSMIFGCRNGKVELFYEVDTWKGRCAEICFDGSIFTSGKGVMSSLQANGERLFGETAGSDQAVYHGLESGRIGSDYVYTRAYEIVAGRGEVGGMTIYRPLSDEKISAEFYQCIINDKTIYAYRILENTPGNVLEHTLDYIAENEDRLGVKFFSYDTMKVLCDAQEQKLSIAQEKKPVLWQAVLGCEEYLYGEKNKN